MTAGRGIMHQEMPQGDAQGRMHGFQLWANLPSSLKMTTPRYQDIKARRFRRSWMMTARGCASCAESSGKEGPVDGVAADPRYLDVFVPPGKRKTLKVEVERHAFAYVFEGTGIFTAASQPIGILSEKQVDGNEIRSAKRPVIARWCCSISATRSPFRLATKAFASCWFRQADPGAGRLVRSDRDEYADGASAGRFRTTEWHVHQGSNVGAPCPLKSFKSA